ncbi:hypothetical protein LTR65_008335 [Meristemomyces frigidus]
MDWFTDSCGSDDGAKEHTGRTSAHLFALWTTLLVGSDSTTVYDVVTATTIGGLLGIGSPATSTVDFTVVGELPAAYVSWTQLHAYVAAYLSTVLVWSPDQTSPTQFSKYFTATIPSAATTLFTTLSTVEEVATGITTRASTSTLTSSTIASSSSTALESGGYGEARPTKNRSLEVVLPSILVPALAFAVAIFALWRRRQRLDRQGGPLIQLPPQETVESPGAPGTGRGVRLAPIDTTLRELPDRALQSPRELHNAHLGARFPELEAAPSGRAGADAALPNGTPDPGQVLRSPSLGIVEELEQRFAARRGATVAHVPEGNQHAVVGRTSNGDSYTVLGVGPPDSAFVNASGTFWIESASAVSLVTETAYDGLNPGVSAVTIEVLHTAGPFRDWQHEWIATDSLQIIGTAEPESIPTAAAAETD